MVPDHFYEGIRHAVRITTDCSRTSCGHWPHEEAVLVRFQKMVDYSIERQGRHCGRRLFLSPRAKAYSSPAERARFYAPKAAPSVAITAFAPLA